jgi:hypothetical protein
MPETRPRQVSYPEGHKRQAPGTGTYLDETKLQLRHPADRPGLMYLSSGGRTASWRLNWHDGGRLPMRETAEGNC